MGTTSYLNTHNKVVFKYKPIKGFLSVIIPVYKDVDGLMDTLDSLTRQSLQSNEYEIIVANDGGSKSISELCRKYKTKEVIIRPNKGSYNARNKALEVSKGQYIAFTDADVIVPKNWLKEGINNLKNDYDYVGGPINIDKNKVKTIANNFEYFNNPFPVSYFLNDLHFFPTANVYTKRLVIEKIGGFDRRLFSAGDLEFGNRVIDYGYKVKLDNDLTVTHPPRRLISILKKIQRVEKGRNDLYRIYPTRFNWLKKSRLPIILNNLRIPFLNREELQYKHSIRLFVLKLFLNYYSLYTTIKFGKFR